MSSLIAVDRQQFNIRVYGSDFEVRPITGGRINFLTRSMAIPDRGRCQLSIKLFIFPQFILCFLPFLVLVSGLPFSSRSNYLLADGLGPSASWRGSRPRGDLSRPAPPALSCLGVVSALFIFL